VRFARLDIFEAKISNAHAVQAPALQQC